MGLSLRRVHSNPSNQGIHEILQLGNQVILGKEDKLRLCLCTILANGHLLIEDVPGVGKTTLVRYLAKVLGLSDRRIQFTNDLLPSDILGTNIFDTKNNKFFFRPGPIFGQIIIADELNRANPKTQSAFLQAMEEKLVSIEGQTHSLPDPFLVVATQNPHEHAGTFSLPDSQLDRFLMRIQIGYPDANEEKVLLKGEKREDILKKLDPLCDASQILGWQKQVSQIHVSDALADYVQRLLQKSRSMFSGPWGLSPRAGLSLIAAAKAWAFMDQREMVLPEDVQAVGVSVMSHRLNQGDDESGKGGQQRAMEILESVKVDS